MFLGLYNLIITNQTCPPIAIFIQNSCQFDPIGIRLCEISPSTHFLYIFRRSEIWIRANAKGACCYATVIRMLGTRKGILGKICMKMEGNAVCELNWICFRKKRKRRRGFKARWKQRAWQTGNLELMQINVCARARRYVWEKKRYTTRKTIQLRKCQIGEPN